MSRPAVPAPSFSTAAIAPPSQVLDAKSVHDFDTLTASGSAALAGSNLAFAEELYALYLRDPASVTSDWQAFFAELEQAPTAAWEPLPTRAQPTSQLFDFNREHPADAPGRPPRQLDAETLRRRVALLKGYHLFRDLGESELAQLAGIADEVSYSDGEFLYHDGDAGDSLFVVQSGQVMVYREGSLLVELAPGQVTGELCLLYSQPRSADVQAKGATTALRLRRNDFELLLDTQGHLARVVMQNFTQRLSEINASQERVDMLIRGYRVRGHVIAQLDPLSTRPQRHPELELSYYGLTEADLDSTFSCRTMHGAPVLTLRQIILRLRNTYCGPIGVQYMHIDDPDMKDWLQVRMETSQNRCELGREEQIRIFTKLTDAEVFEAFLQKKFVGAKRFSLEGGESLIPLLDLALEEASGHGVDEVVIAMAHRGRLNVLANIMGKSPQQIFREFEDADAADNIGRGDVKYHLGHASFRTGADGRKQKLQLCFNPSHLEFVNPVAIGRVRARQDRLGDTERRRVMPIIIHGDAAFAGQGIVQETLNLGDLPGYSVGGTIHIIVNNQIGFTTPPESSRSSLYATDVAKLLQVPIFHVNGEHPEGVAQVIKLAMAFRDQFQQDVVVDMYCYRRHGHNEGDDPTFTQPLMYQAIRARKSVVDGYLDALLADERHAGMTREEAREIAMRSQLRLEEGLLRARSEKPAVQQIAAGSPWAQYRGGRDRLVPEVDTTVARDRLADLMAMQCKLPEGFTPHPKIVRLLQNRLEMGNGNKALDWGAGEALAFASIAVDGRPLRLSGQDSGRGTFSHRHAVLHDYQNGKLHVPLQHLSPDQGQVEILDSSLSEASVLGFDYGYSLDQPDGLTIWEAQFGDFSNCAQVIIDQFISSSEDKWQRLSGIAMLLPHGFEGQGPEHSSARLERFLNISAEDNIQVVNLTTPAQLFHCLRRQVMRAIRKPLVVMSPKSLLRHPEAVSTLEELTTGGFQRVIPDATVDPRTATRVLLCSGKVYYDLVQARRDKQRPDVAIVRVEQLYPLSDVELRATLAPFAAETPVLWVQEEPRNMGAWVFLRMRLGKRLFGKWTMYGVSRPESASPATGSNGAHKLEQARLMDEAFGPLTVGTSSHDIEEDSGPADYPLNQGQLSIEVSAGAPAAEG